MLNEKLFIKLDNDCFLDEYISNDELMVFTLIQKCLNEAKGISMFSANLLLDFMYITKTNHNKIADTVKKSLINLLNKGLIENVYNVHFEKLNSIDSINNKDIIIAEIEPLKTNYFTINEFQLDKLFEHLKDKNIKKANIIRYFIAIQRVMNYSPNVGLGYLAQNKCKNLIGENKTISSYNEILQDELKLIRYCNDYMTPEYKYITTFFGNYKDKDKFNQFVAAEVKERGLVKTNKTVSNTKRSKKQQINKLESKLNKTKSDIKKIEKVKKEYDDLQYKPKSLEITEEMITDYDEFDELFG